MDILCPYTRSTLHETCEPAGPRHLAEQYKLRHTPKHEGWLKMTQIEINARTRQCPDPRFPPRPNAILHKVSARARFRNAHRAKPPGGDRVRTEDVRAKRKSLDPRANEIKAQC